MRKPLVLVLAAAAVTTALAAPALATCGSSIGDVCSGTTTVAFTVIDTGSLSILPTAAAPATGSSVDAAGKRTVTMSLGVTSVLDSRTSSPGWTASATAGNFTGTTTAATVAGTGAKFFVGSAPGAVATNLLTGLLSTATCPAGVTYVSTPTGTNGSAALVTAPSGAISACAYTPSLQLDVTSAPADAYTGTVTQSVS
jgi:hypothetical protein